MQMKHDSGVRVRMKTLLDLESELESNWLIGEVTPTWNPSRMASKSWTGGFSSSAHELLPVMGQQASPKRERLSKKKYLRTHEWISEGYGNNPPWNVLSVLGSLEGSSSQCSMLNWSWLQQAGSLCFWLSAKIKLSLLPELTMVSLLEIMCT